jgi:hypothetical protein
MWSFWYSEQHAEHYRWLNKTGVLGWPPMPLPKNYINDVVYTACVENADAKEPYDGALENFPDYKKVAVGSDENIRVEGRW